jgi:hypothetical protein
VAPVGVTVTRVVRQGRGRERSIIWRDAFATALLPVTRSGASEASFKAHAIWLNGAVHLRRVARRGSC